MSVSNSSANGPQNPRPPPLPPLQVGDQSSTNSGSSSSFTYPTPPAIRNLPLIQDPLTESAYPDFDHDEARQNPRKYSGYRVFSRWMASDRALFIVRRFGTLNTRVLLAMQDEIAELEERLDFMDRAYSRHAIDDSVDNGTFRGDPFNDRNELVTTILPAKLARYNDYINSYSQLLARPPLRADDIQNVARWLSPAAPRSAEDLRNPLPYLGPIDDLEAAFINHHDDLVGVQPKTRSWFRNVLESTLILRTPFVRTFFERKPDEYETINTNSKTIWQKDNRVEGLSSGIIALGGLGMLVGPLWILNYFSSSRSTQLGIITGFIVLFFILVAVATTARVFDALAAAAAYSAVLMVFIQLGLSTH